MPLQLNDILEACELLAQKDGLQVCIKESLKGAALAGLGSFIGGVLMGPLGVAIGGTVGGIAGCSICEDYQPLHQVIQEMSPAEKKKLADHMLKTLNSLDITDAVFLMTIVNNPAAVGRSGIVKQLGTYFGQSMMSVAS